MRLEAIAIDLRRRSPWEALDLGHALWRNWVRRIYAAWFATYGLAGIIILLLLWRWPDAALFVLWWLKPLFDRVLLHVCSRSAFGEPCGVGEVLRAVPRLWCGAGAVSSLTLRRLSLARSFLLPVWQLEEQRGAEAGARFRVLARRYRAYAGWLTFFCANMVSILVLAVLFTLFALAPGDSQGMSLWEWFGDDASSARQVLRHLALMAAESVVEPLYVASGFALYLNRRSELEAWDVELGLRSLAARCSAARRATQPLALLAAALLCWPLAPADAAQALPAVTDREVRPALSHAALRQAIDAVLAEPVFGEVKDDWSWRWRQDAAASETQSEGARNGFAALGRWIDLFELLAELLRAVLWIAAAVGLAAIVWIVIRYRKRWPALTPRAAARPGVDADVPSLPADLVAVARAELAAGRVVEALSLLYRAALQSLIARRIELAAGDTEDDCLRGVAGRLPEATERCFADLVEAWQLAAYGHQPVAPARVEALLAGWESHFGKLPP